MTVDPADARQAIGETVGRLTALLRSVRDPDAPALGSWSIAELAMHVSQVCSGIPALARQDRSVFEAAVLGAAGGAGTGAGTGGTGTGAGTGAGTGGAGTGGAGTGAATGGTGTGGAGTGGAGAGAGTGGAGAGAGTGGAGAGAGTGGAGIGGTGTGGTGAVTVASAVTDTGVVTGAVASAVTDTGAGSGAATSDETGLVRDIWSLAELTVSWVRSDGERDLALLADRIEARIQEFLDTARPDGPDDPVPWLVDGTSASQTMLMCHLLNETVVHGYDIAKAAGLGWTIPRGHAGMVIEGFLIPVLKGLGPNTMVDQEKAAGVELTYELRIRGGGRYRLRFSKGSLTVGDASSRPVDCRISADPVALLLTIWGRESQLRALARGQLVAWGRKPWAAPKLRTLLRNP